MRQRSTPLPKPSLQVRIFDHMHGEPEDAVFCVIAKEIKQSPWWTDIPVYEPPDTVSGEIDAR